MPHIVCGRGGCDGAWSNHTYPPLPVHSRRRFTGDGDLCWSMRLDRRSFCFGLEGDARRFAVHLVNSFLRLVPHLGSSPAGRLGYLHSEELKNGSVIPWERKGSALQVVQHVPTQLWYQGSSASGALTHTCTKTKFSDLVVSSAVPVHHPSL